MINRTSGEYPSENIPVEKESGCSRLEGLARNYESEKFILSGIDNEAQKITDW